MGAHGQKPPDERRGSDGKDSLDLVLDYARQSYGQQFAAQDAYRTRAGSLLAFAAVLVALSAGAVPRGGGRVAQAAGTVFVVLSVGLLCLLLGTVIIGLRVALLLP